MYYGHQKKVLFLWVICNETNYIPSHSSVPSVLNYLHTLPAPSPVMPWYIFFKSLSVFSIGFRTERQSFLYCSFLDPLCHLSLSLSLAPPHSNPSSNIKYLLLLRSPTHFDAIKPNLSKLFATVWVTIPTPCAPPQVKTERSGGGGWIPFHTPHFRQCYFF